VSIYKEKYRDEYNTAEYLSMQIDKGGWVHRKIDEKWYVACHISKFKSYIENNPTR